MAIFPLRTGIDRFVRSGSVDLAYNFLRVFGRYGSGWSSVFSDYLSNYTAMAYRLSITITELDPSTDFNRSNGFPVRCLV